MPIQIEELQSVENKALVSACISSSDARLINTVRFADNILNHFPDDESSDERWHPFDKMREA